MIKRGWDKSSCDVAINTVCVGRYVFAAFAYNDVTVVAIRAVVDDALMVEVCLGKRSCDMADRTIFVRGDVIRIHFG